VKGTAAPDPVCLSMRMRVALAVAASVLLTACLPHPPPPAAPFHALGKDSAWNLIIDDKHVTFIPAGGQPMREPKAPLVPTADGGSYRTPRIQVSVVDGPCTIGERTYPARVTVFVDGVRHEGCRGL